VVILEVIIPTMAGELIAPSVWIRIKAFFVWALARLLLATVRVRVVHPERLEQARSAGQPLLYAFWHGRQLALFKANPERGRSLAVMTSRSADGQMQALICRRFGLQVVRGSSSRGALAGILAMGRALRRGACVGVAVDGPRGPAFEAKPGIIALARASGVPVVPITVGFRRRWELGRAWDRFQIPKPFTTATVVFGEPIRLDRGADQAEVDRQARRLGQALRDLTRLADRSAGDRPTA